MRALSLLAALALPGCVVLPDPDWLDDPGPDDDDVNADDDDDEPDPCTDPSDPENWVTEPPAEWLVGAHFELPDGSPAMNLMITLCGDSCFNEPTNCAGDAYFPVAPADSYVLEPLFAYEQRYAEFARSFDIVTYDPADGQLFVPAPQVLPTVEEVEPLGSGLVERTFASGLVVRYEADAVTLPFGPEAGSLGAVEIPPARWPTGGLAGWTPLRVWALAVWDMEIEEGGGFAVEAPLVEPVPDGDEVAFLVAHYELSIVSGTFEAFPAEASEDRATIRTPEGAGIDRSTLWIAARRTPAP